MIQIRVIVVLWPVDAADQILWKEEKKATLTFQVQAIPRIGDFFAISPEFDNVKVLMVEHYPLAYDDVKIDVTLANAMISTSIFDAQVASMRKFGWDVFAYRRS